MITKSIASELLGMLLSVKEFVLAQAPDVLKQVISWEIASSTLWILIALALGGVAYKLACSAIKAERRDINSCDSIPSGLAAILIGMLASITFLTNLFSLVKVLVAPKVFLIEYLSNLIKN